MNRAMYDPRFPVLVRLAAIRTRLDEIGDEPGGGDESLMMPASGAQFSRLAEDDAASQRRVVGEPHDGAVEEAVHRLPTR